MQATSGELQTKVRSEETQSHRSLHKIKSKILDHWKVRLFVVLSYFNTEARKIG